MITVVFAIRNRSKHIVERCISSLRGQDCKVIVVDYGSDDISWYPEVIGNFVRAGHGEPDFNKSRALNIGMRLATTPYVISSDIDNIFARNFIKTVKAHIKPKALILCRRHDILRNGTLRLHPPTAFGACFGIERSWIEKVHGYDEGFVNWGKEDDDLYRRAIADGYEPVWIEGETHIHHQYHEPASRHSLSANTKRLIHSRGVVRNSHGWGKLV